MARFTKQIARSITKDHHGAMRREKTMSGGVQNELILTQKQYV
jgi:hypothetical protein